MEKERYIVKPEDLKGEIEGFPIEVVQRMVDEAIRQYGEVDIAFFQTNIDSGFTWAKSIEGVEFWFNVIANRNFDLFFERYPKTSDSGISGNPMTYAQETTLNVHYPVKKKDITLDSVIQDQVKGEYKQRLYETAKAAMQGLLANPNPDLVSRNDKYLTGAAIEYAKELLRQLEEEEENKE